MGRKESNQTNKQTNNDLNVYVDTSTAVPTKSDSDEIFCLQLLGKILTCTLHLS